MIVGEMVDFRQQIFLLSSQVSCHLLCSLSLGDEKRFYDRRFLFGSKLTFPVNLPRNNLGFGQPSYVSSGVPSMGVTTSVLSLVEHQLSSFSSTEY